MTTENVKAKGISSFWVLVIVVPLVTLGLWIAISHANASQDRATRAANAKIERKFQQAIRISDDKHRQALHSQAILFSYSINKTACLLIGIAHQQISRLEKTKTVGYKQAEKFWQHILENQVPIPASFDCSTLPKTPPKP